MSNDTDAAHLFTRRALLLGGMQAVGLLVLGGRLIDLQIRQNTKYKLLAEDNRINTQLVPPPRGRIYDRNNALLADTNQIFQLLAVPEQVKNFPALLDFINGIVPLSEDDRERILRDKRRAPSFTPILITANMSWEQVSQIELAVPDWQGMSINPAPMRTYPLGAPFAHVLGYVGTPNDAEAQQNPLLLLPNIKIGKSGLESRFEAPLRGTAGQRKLEINAHGEIVRQLDDVPGIEGQDLSLHIDAGLQNTVYNRLLKEESASAVVMNAQTGAVYALASTPAFDPNDFIMGISHKKWQDLLNDPHAPLTNKAISGQYAPGSTYKVIVALAALESGAATTSARVYCPGYTDIGKHRFHCWKRGGHGNVDMHDAIAQSCDVYFYDVARRLGVEKLNSTARRFGLGAKTNIELPGERAGLLPDKNWKLKNFRRPWQTGDTLNISIGQGSMLATPLQLATMTATLVNGGNLVAPKLLKSKGGTPQPLLPTKTSNASKAYLDFIVKAMAAVVDEKKGTASAAQSRDKDWKFGGKTGTSQVRRITKAERITGIVANEDRPWKERDHALFVGFAPLDKPRFVCSVVVEHGGGGSHTAAPIARDIFAACKNIST